MLPIEMGDASDFSFKSTVDDGERPVFIDEPDDEDEELDELYGFRLLLLLLLAVCSSNDDKALAELIRPFLLLELFALL